MKKFILSLFVLTFLFSPLAHAARTTVDTLINTTLLDNSPTAVSGTTSVKSSDKIAFFVTNDETEVGASVSVAITVFVSWDNATWLQASFYDYAGAATLQTSETISADGNYYFWFNSDLAVPYVKVTITATNTDADDTASVKCYIVKQEL